jgi:hypothetical protein
MKDMLFAYFFKYIQGRDVSFSESAFDIACIFQFHIAGRDCLKNMSCDCCKIYLEHWDGKIKCCFGHTNSNSKHGMVSSRQVQFLLYSFIYLVCIAY